MSISVPACLQSLIACMILVLPVSAQESVELRGISVAARRTADVGYEESKVDSAALRESVALSLADVLGYNSSIFIKDYGRATLATASFRGTSPSHTQVSWNGMRISSPMLGSTDFSMIPSYFIDRASILHGSSSLGDVGGGLGGLIKLSTEVADVPKQGLSGQYVQGIGSWRTFDEFLRLGYSHGRFRATARVAYSSSRNDFTFINHDKKENIYDDNHNIVSSYFPKERNRSGSFKDFHALGSVSYDAGVSGRFGADVWYLSTNRELPLLTSDYSTNKNSIENRQREQTVRAVATWDKVNLRSRLTARAGYIHTWLAYDYKKANTDGISSTILTSARSRVNTAFGAISWKCYPSSKWYFTADADMHHHSVQSYDTAPFNKGTGYDHSRAELSAAVSAKWRPVKRLGLGALLREEVFGDKVSAPIPAIFAEATLVPEIGLVAKLSGSRNSRFPSLNDLYTVPGGNPELKPEHGWNYDAGLSTDFAVGERWQLAASANWFDSYINDWILWLPSSKGYYVPRNISKVHAYGVESEMSAVLKLNHDWSFGLTAHYSWTASINRSSHIGGEGDKSVGKQLPYVPRHSASAVARAEWRGWALAYKWQCYSERFTMSSNESSLTGHLPAYSVSNITLEKSFGLFRLDWLAKLAVNNVFDADYQTVLSRPMPGINFEAFLSVNF